MNKAAEMSANRGEFCHLPLTVSKRGDSLSADEYDFALARRNLV